MMMTLTPEDATPIAYGMNVMGADRIWSIGADTKYPELCMAIINYLTTPEGYMTYRYGPKDLNWYYDVPALLNLVRSASPIPRQICLMSGAAEHSRTAAATLQ